MVEQWKRTKIFNDGSAAIYVDGDASMETPVAHLMCVRSKHDLNLMAAAPALLSSLQEAKSQIMELCGAAGIPYPEASFERFDKAIAQALKNCGLTVRKETR